MFKNQLIGFFEKQCEIIRYCFSLTSFTLASFYSFCFILPTLCSHESFLSPLCNQFFFLSFHLCCKWVEFWCCFLLTGSVWILAPCHCKLRRPASLDRRASLGLVAKLLICVNNRQEHCLESEVSTFQHGCKLLLWIYQCPNAHELTGMKVVILLLFVHCGPSCNTTMFLRCHVCFSGYSRSVSQPDLLFIQISVWRVWVSIALLGNRNKKG